MENLNTVQQFKQDGWGIYSPFIFEKVIEHIKYIVIITNDKVKVSFKTALWDVQKLEEKTNDVLKTVYKLIEEFKTEYAQDILFAQEQIANSIKFGVCVTTEEERDFYFKCRRVDEVESTFKEKFGLTTVQIGKDFYFQSKSWGFGLTLHEDENKLHVYHTKSRQYIGEFEYKRDLSFTLNTEHKRQKKDLEEYTNLMEMVCGFVPVIPAWNHNFCKTGLLIDLINQKVEIVKDCH